jgi:small subunit ribosomal protein S7
MSALASTSALRLVSGSLRQSASFSVAAASKRSISSTSFRWAGNDSNDTTPARDHRTGTSESRAAGGPDFDPVTSTPRNASTDASSKARSRSAEMLADLAQELGSRPSSSLRSQFDMPEMDKIATPAAPGFTAPSGYSTDTLPLKVDPTLEAFVNNLMKDGKKASATRHILDMMQFLSQALHADPLPAVQAAIEAAGPLIRMQTRKSGGKNVSVPMALGAHQSRRKAIVSIIEASKKRSDKKLSVRLAKEIIAVLEGSSSTLARKEELHRLAMVNRSNTDVRL